MTVTASDLELYMGSDTINSSRADLLIAQATLLCESVVTPLPAAADVVIISAAARAYSNPQGVTAESVGPYNVQRPWAGIYLTKAERAALRRMAGSGGAFSVDPTPAKAGPGNAWAQVPLSPLDIETQYPFFGDWDQPTP